MPSPPRCSCCAIIRDTSDVECPVCGASFSMPTQPTQPTRLTIGSDSRKA